jgi:hypothetical protein
LCAFKGRQRAGNNQIAFQIKAEFFFVAEHETTVTARALNTIAAGQSLLSFSHQSEVLIASKVEAHGQIT